MPLQVLLIVIATTCSLLAQLSASPVKELKAGHEYEDQIKTGEEKLFGFELEQKRRYMIRVEQKGIDLIIRLNDAKGKLIKQQDTPNGNVGPETIFFEPENNDRFQLSVKPLVKPNNPSSGPFSIKIDRAPSTLTAYSLAKTQRDFDLLVESLKEAHPGLDWYSTYKEYGDFCANQRKLLSDKMTALDFYRVVAPIIAFTKEGHTAISLSPEDTNYLQAFGRYFPFQIKFLNKRPYVINDFGGISAKGQLLSKVNGKSVDEILDTLMSAVPDDGYIVSGKYRWIEENGAFPWFYLLCFGDAQTFSVELTDPKTNQQTDLTDVRGVRFSEYRRLWRGSAPTGEVNFPPGKIEFRPEIKTAILSFNTFDTVFKGNEYEFKAFTDQAFNEIRKRSIENLIIDVRKNDGGEEGLEDYVFSYLTDKPFMKYRYVQAMATTFSFLDFTTFKTKDRQSRFEASLKDEVYRETDGRWLRKKGYMPTASPRPDAFLGKLYILTGGLTYSGGSEFASIVKGNRQAIFIGEETGGGYYGNTSGRYLNLELPNTRTSVRIPLLKFVLEIGGEIPFGRGVIPDYEVEPTIDEYLGDVDAAMNRALKLISEGN